MDDIRNIVYGVYFFWATRAQLTFAVIGTVFVLWILLFQTIPFIWAFVRPSDLPIYCHCERGSWALVTGASDGIGLAFSEELLSRGFNVLLHGRSHEKLTRIRDELSQRYERRTVDLVVADASKYDDSYNIVADKVKTLPGKLTILVNNVGGISTRPQYSSQAEMSHEDLDIQINLNARFPTHLTTALLPLFSRPSIILNCGSSGGQIGAPYVVTYSSTKAYMHAFSRGLKNEMVAEGINDVDVLGLIIGNVISAGNPHKMPFTITSRDCAASCLDSIGTSKAVVCPHWKHRIQLMAVDILPEALLRRFVAEEMRGRHELERKET